MRRSRKLDGQLSLLDWDPPRPVRAFRERDVQAPDIAGRLSRAISVSLSDAADPRSAIAGRMSDYLGARVSTAMLDAYASQGRPTHQISVPRYAALLHATGDQRLLELLAAPEGLAVIDRRYLVQIEIASLHERQEELRKRGDTLRRLSRFRS